MVELAVNLSLAGICSKQTDEVLVGPSSVVRSQTGVIRQAVHRPENMAWAAWRHCAIGEFFIGSSSVHRLQTCVKD